jgi:hypothetical protein
MQMDYMICPKCGNCQEEGRACLKCGLIFMGNYSNIGNLNPIKKPVDAGVKPAVKPSRRFLRIFLWTAAAGLIVFLGSIVLILQPSPPPKVIITPEVTRSAEAKIEKFYSSIQQGGDYQLEMNQSEVNAWLYESLASRTPDDSMAAESQTAEPSTETARPSFEDAPANRDILELSESSLRDVKMELLDDSVRIYALFSIHGMDFSLELEGKPVIDDGYITLEPSGGKAGSLPLTAGTLKTIINHIFNSQQNKENFRLSSDIRDIRIERGHVIITSR